jgi:putative oxidoreductase
MNAFIPSKVAEIVFGLIIGMFGVFHFMNAEGMSAMIPVFMPGDAMMWVYITGAFLLLAAISIITGKQKTLASYLLAVMLLIFALTIHLRSVMDGNEQSMGLVLRDSAMAMCAILIGNRNDK